MDAKKFGAFIAQVRREKEMTQKQLAQKLNVTDKAVSRWERGLGFPDISLLEPLADALGLTITELIKSERIPQEDIPQKEVSELLKEAFTILGDQWEEKWEKKRNIAMFFIFLISMAALLISVAIFWNMGIYVDEVCTSPDRVVGGSFWLGMDWLRLGMLAVLAAVSLFSMFSSRRGPMLFVLIASAVVLLLSVFLLRNMQAYADMAGVPLAAITGGNFWAMMDGLRLVLMAAATVLADAGLQAQEQKKRRWRTARRI